MTVKKKKKEYLVAVYGSLMEGLHNNHRLRNSELMGTWLTEPVFTLGDLGSFPGLLENGNTSVNMEIYKIDTTTLVGLDNLEGYNEGNENMSMYLRKTIDTPYGEAFVYIYNASIPSNKEVNTGDWREHIIFKQNLQGYAC